MQQLLRQGLKEAHPRVERSDRQWGQLGYWPGVFVLDLVRAEEVGFEPTVALRPQRFSRPSDSSALALLQVPAEASPSAVCPGAAQRRPAKKRDSRTPASCSR